MLSKLLHAGSQPQGLLCVLQRRNVQLALLVLVAVCAALLGLDPTAAGTLMLLHTAPDANAEAPDAGDAPIVESGGGEPAAPDVGGEAEPAAGAAPVQKTPDQVRTGMLDAITKGLDPANKAADPKAKDTAAKLPQTPEEKAAAEAKKADPNAKPKDEKPKDDIYKMPAGLKPDSQVRFQKLVDTTKAAVTRAETAEGKAKVHEETINGFRDVLRDTQTSSEDLSQLLEYNRMVKSGDLEGALKLLDAQRAVIAQHLGRPVEGVDVLEGFPDLQEAVKNSQMTPEYAAELARSRRVEHGTRQQNERARQAQETQTQRRQTVDNALNDITAFCKEMSANDVDYKKKEEILLKAVDEISKEFPPNLWLAQVKLMYKNIVAAAAPAPAARQHQPLRPNAGGGGQAKPKTALEAIERGLGYSPTA